VPAVRIYTAIRVIEMVEASDMLVEAGTQAVVKIVN